MEFVLSDLFSALPGRRFHLIGANLPYVSEEEYAVLPSEVRDFEPKGALVASDGGLGLIRRAMEELPEHLLPGGGAISELSPEQAGEAAGILRKNGLTPSILRDLCGRERFVAGVMP